MMNKDILDLRQSASGKLNRLQAKAHKVKHFRESIDRDKKSLEELEKEKTILEESQKALMLFLEQGKQKSKEIFEQIGSVALADVFGEGYRLSIEYDEKYATSHAEVRVTMPTIYGEEITTGLANRGGGLNDLVSMAFRLCQLNLISPEPQGPLMADEAFKHLDKPRRPDCAAAMRAVLNPDNNGAEGEGRQLIFTTHAEEFLSPNEEGVVFPDKVFRCHLNKKENRTVIEDVTDEFQKECEE